MLLSGSPASRTSAWQTRIGQCDDSETQTATSHGRVVGVSSMHLTKSLVCLLILHELSLIFFLCHEAVNNCWIILPLARGLESHEDQGLAQACPPCHLLSAISMQGLLNFTAFATRFSIFILSQALPSSRLRDHLEEDRKTHAAASAPVTDPHILSRINT